MSERNVIAKLGLLLLVAFLTACAPKEAPICEQPDIVPDSGSLVWKGRWYEPVDMQVMVTLQVDGTLRYEDRKFWPVGDRVPQFGCMAPGKATTRGRQ